MKFITKPFLTIKFILKLLFEYTMAFGGVDIGIIKAQLADRMKGVVSELDQNYLNLQKHLKLVIIKM